MTESIQPESIQVDPRRLLGARLIVATSPRDARIGSKVGGKPTITGESILSAKIGTKGGQKQQPR